MLPPIYSEEIEEVAINFAYEIFNSEDEADAAEILEEGLIADKGSSFNYSQRKIIVARVFTILHTIIFLKDLELPKRIFNQPLEDFCKKHNYDVHTVTIAMDMLFGKEEKLTKKKKCKIFTLPKK